MILQSFSKTLHSYAAKVPTTIILGRWLNDILRNPPKNNVEKIIHTELTLLEGEDGMFAIVGTDKNGQKLLESLCRFVESYDNQTFSRWLHNKKANDFNEDEENTLS